MPGRGSGAIFQTPEALRMTDAPARIAKYWRSRPSLISLMACQRWVGIFAQAAHDDLFHLGRTSLSRLHGRCGAHPAAPP